MNTTRWRWFPDLGRGRLSDPNQQLATKVLGDLLGKISPEQFVQTVQGRHLSHDLLAKNKDLRADIRDAFNASQGNPAPLRAALQWACDKRQLNVTVRYYGKAKGGEPIYSFS